MTDRELRRRLSEQKIPVASEASRARALERARQAWRASLSTVEAPCTRKMSWLPWAALASATVLLLAGALHLRTDTPHRDQTSEDDRILLGEVQKLFPDTLCGVIRESGETRLILNERSAPQTDQMVAISVVRGGARVQVLAFSGSELEIPGLPDAGPVEVLSAGDGSIILAGQTFIWHSSKPTRTNGVHLEARLL